MRTEPGKSSHPPAGPNLWLALGVPALLLLAFVLVYARSFPIWETWYFIPVWGDFRTHGPWLADLFIDRWGHIHALPNFINLILDRVFNYDQRAGIFLSVGVTLLSLALLLKRYLPHSAPLTAVFLGLTFLSIRVAEIWLDAWNTAMTIPLLISLAAGACVLRSDAWKWLIACALLLFIGINSGGYCLPAIPAVLLVLIVQALLGRRDSSLRAIARIVAWLMWSAVLLAYWRRMRGGDAGAVIQTLLTADFYRLFAREIAFVLGMNHLGAVLLAATIVVFLLSMPAALRYLRRMESLPALVFLAVYACVMGVLVGTGRVQNGEIPLHERYIPFLCLLPVALLAFAEAVFALRRRDPAGSANGASMGSVATRWLLYAFILAAIYNDVAYFRIFHGTAPQLAALDRAWQESPDTVTPGMFLYRANTHADLIEQGLATMKRLGAGPFHQERSMWHLILQRTPGNPAAKDAASIHIGVDNLQRQQDGNVVIQGWAFDGLTSTPPTTAFATADKCRETALLQLPRSDVAEFFKAPAARDSGWMITLPAHCAAAPNGQVDLYFVTSDGRWNSIERAL